MQFVQAQNAPDFTFTDTEGITHNLQERLDDGYIIVLDFFYVDCPPCIDTGIELEAIHNDYHDSNVEVWSISPFDSIAHIQGFRSENNFTYSMGGLEGGSWDVAEIYTDSLELAYFPTISVICPNGNLNWDIWPYTSGGAPEWRGPIEDCGVHDISITAATDDYTSRYPSALFPNPAEDIVNVEFYAEDIGDVLIDIYDIRGSKIMQKSVSVNNLGQQNVQFSVARLVKGNYVVRLSAEGKSLAILPLQK